MQITHYLGDFDNPLEATDVGQLVIQMSWPAAALDAASEWPPALDLVSEDRHLEGSKGLSRGRIMIWEVLPCYEISAESV